MRGGRVGMMRMPLKSRRLGLGASEDHDGSGELWTLGMVLKGRGRRSTTENSVSCCGD